jgi:DNA-binding MarR family transcriptional regulator
MLRSIPVAAWLRLARVFAKVERLSTEHLRAHGLSHGQFDILAHVGAAPDISQQALADALLVTKGNVCQLLDKMEAAGLLRRRQTGRTNHIALTSTGQALFADVVPAHEALIAQQLDVLPATDQAELLRLLRTLDHALPGSNSPAKPSREPLTACPPSPSTTS